MTPQSYIQSKLEDLKRPLGLTPPEGDDVVEAIFRALMSKKFRKYAANEQLQAHIRGAIRGQVEKREPINITFLHGAYKLWRLEEAPEADWAELFALMYYGNWVKPVCELYAPGVWLDFFVDDLIVMRLDNLLPAEIEAYIKSYQAVMDFLKPYQPANLRMTITRVGSKFDSEAAFDEALRGKMELEKRKTPSGLPELTDTQRAMVELNTRLRPGQADDPKWREKIFQLHDAYLAAKAGAGYHLRPDKIVAFTQMTGSNKVISVGTTKDSVAKFWAGVGALRPREGSFRQVVLPPSQLRDAEFEFENMAIRGLDGRNFKRIRVLH